MDSWPSVSSWRRKRRKKREGKGGVVGFNMHSPGEEEQAALSAEAPVWPL